MFVRVGTRSSLPTFAQQRSSTTPSDDDDVTSYPRRHGGSKPGKKRKKEREFRQNETGRRRDCLSVMNDYFYAYIQAVSDRFSTYIPMPLCSIIVYITSLHCPSSSSHPFGLAGLPPDRPR